MYYRTSLHAQRARLGLLGPPVDGCSDRSVFALFLFQLPAG